MRCMRDGRLRSETPRRSETKTSGGNGHLHDVVFGQVNVEVEVRQDERCVFAELEDEALKVQHKVKVVKANI